MTIRMAPLGIENAAAHKVCNIHFGKCVKRCLAGLISVTMLAASPASAAGALSPSVQRANSLPYRLFENFELHPQPASLYQTVPGPEHSDGETVVNSLPGCGTTVPEFQFYEPPTPERKIFAASPGGVDMRSGSFVFDNTDLSIGGEGDAGLSLVRTFSYIKGTTTLSNTMGTFFTHNWDVKLIESRPETAGACYPNEYDYNVMVQYGGLGESFRSDDSPVAFTQVAPQGYAELTAEDPSPRNYVFTARDGTEIEFLTMPVGIANANYCGNSISQAGLKRCTVATSITRPDGTVYSLDYDILSDGYTRRLRSVTSTRGYALLFQYSGSGTLVTKVCALNLTVTTPPSNYACPSTALASSYTYSGNVQTSATDASNGVWSFTQPTSMKFAIKRPGAASPFVTNTYVDVYGTADPERRMAVTHQDLVDGETYDYDWTYLTNVNSNNASTTKQVTGGTWTDSNAKTVTVTYGKYKKIVANYPEYNNVLYPTPGPVSVKDQLDRETKFEYCSTADGTVCAIPPLQSVTYPEGNREEFDYTSYRNVSGITRVGKPNTGLNTSEARDYPTFSGSTPTTRAKPISVTDARGKVTNFTYDPVHGGVTLELDPADANGVRPGKVYKYIERYARYRNSAGTVVQAPTGVWVLSSMTTCRSTAINPTSGACGSRPDGHSDAIVTIYDYGPTTGANNLLVRGVSVVAADAAGTTRTYRTCYDYDAQGNKVAETKPNAHAACY